MSRPRFPVFQSFRGPAESPTDAVAIRSLGYDEGMSAAHAICGFVDEVASGVETIAASPDVAHLADGWRAAAKILSIAIPEDLIQGADADVAGAHALALGVDLMLTVFPPGPPRPALAPVAASRMLRWQFTLPLDRLRFGSIQELATTQRLFPARFVSAPYLDAGRGRAFGPARLRAAATGAPSGRNMSLVLSAEEDWTTGEHLMVALVGSRAEPFWAVAGTLLEGLDEAAFDELAERLMGYGADGGFLHPLLDAVWANMPSRDTWVAARRVIGPPPPNVSGGPARVDLSAFASRERLLDSVPIVPGAVCWLGPGWQRAARRPLETFSECDENRDLGGGRRRIQLADPTRKISPELVARQRALRQALGLDAPTAPAVAPPSTDEVRLRLAEDQRRTAAKPTTARPVEPPIHKRGVSLRTATSSADAALGLRFTVKECVIGTTGFVGRNDAGERLLEWASIGAVLVRLMPPDPPYERAPLLDLVPSAGGPPLRVVAATRVNYAAMPGGAAHVALENLRRLGRLVLERNPGVTLDAETRGFLEGRPPAAFAGFNQFTAYDAGYGG